MTDTRLEDAPTEPAVDGKVKQEAFREPHLDRPALAGILDREIASEEFDAFGHRHFAQALGSLIESSSYKPPYSIGLLGPWGSGKSSVKALYRESVRRDRQKRDGLTRSDRFFLVEFNAWRYGGEDIRRALLRHVFLELGGKEERLRDVITRTTQHEREERRSIKDVLRESGYQTLILLITFLVFGLFVGGIYWLITTYLPVPDDWPELPLAVLPAFAFLWFVQQLWDKLSSVLAYRPVIAIEDPQTSAEEYEGLLIEQLEAFKHKNKKRERIVVFVDDLDRLSAEEMVTGLDAIRTFMELPSKKRRELGIVFVISCDEERVAAALSNRQRQRENPETPGAVFTITDARKFLDRIFQFRLEIPPLPPQDLRLFARRKLLENMGNVAMDIQQRGVSLDDVIDRLIPPDVQDPRTAVQSLNLFSQSWWLARQREFAGTGSDQAGGLQQGAVTDHPIALAALCALKISIPDFYAALSVEPRLIVYFTDIYLRGTVEEIPEPARVVLHRYEKVRTRDEIQDEVEKPGRVSSERAVAEGYRPLRRYIASLQSLSWPVSLQPLLLLSQDSVTRKYGDRAPAAFNALASGDQQAVLESLGRELDSDPLRTDEVRLLRGMQEDLEIDTSVRRENAAAAFAALAPRLAAPENRQLLTPVARNLVTSENLRARLGIDGIAQVLPAVGPADRAAVAGRLVEDLLKPEEQEISLRTTGGQPMTLAEAVTAIDVAMPLVLSVWTENGLQPPQEGQLLEWLTHRSIKAEGRTSAQPFKQLDAWVASFQGSLLPALGANYIDMLADEIEKGRAAQIDLPVAIARAHLVFDDLALENRPRLWMLLTRLISLQSAEAVAFAREVAEKRRRNASEAEFSSFMQALAARLVKEDTDQSEWGLIDWKVEAAAFLEFAESRQEIVSQETWATFDALAISWSDDDSAGEYAVRLLDLLYRNSQSTGSAVADDWIGRVTATSEAEEDELAESCRAWIGMHFSDRLSAEQREQLQSGLAEVLNGAAVSEEESLALMTFISNVSDTDRQTDEMQELLATALRLVVARHTNPNRYLDRIVPVAALLIEVSPIADFGPQLSTLFAQTQANPSVFSSLHGYLLGHWPIAPAGGPPVDFQPLFTQSMSVLRQYSNSEGAGDILRSLEEMFRHGLVPEEHEIQLVNGACDIWGDQRAAASEVLLAHDIPASPDLVADLVTAIDPESSEDVRDLHVTWSHIAMVSDSDHRLAVAEAIVAKSPINSSSVPDLGLSVWIDSQGDTVGKLLERLATSAEPNDAQRIRVWHQIDRLSNRLDPAFFQSVLLYTLMNGSGDVARVVLGSRNKITELFVGPAARHDLMLLLLNAFVHVADLEIKRQLATWLHEVDGEPILKEAKNQQEIDLVDVDLLLERFPTNRSLRNLQTRLAKD